MVLNCAAIYCQISSIHMNQQTCKSVRFCSLYKGSLCHLSSHWSIFPDTFLWLANSSLSIISSVSFGIELPVAKSRTILALVVRSNWLSSKLSSHWSTLTSLRSLIGQRRHHSLAAQRCAGQDEENLSLFILATRHHISYINDKNDSNIRMYKSLAIVPNIRRNEIPWWVHLFNIFQGLFLCTTFLIVYFAHHNAQDLWWVRSSHFGTFTS